MLNKYVNIDDIIQGHVLALTDMIDNKLTERLSYRRRENNEIISSRVLVIRKQYRRQAKPFK